MDTFAIIVCAAAIALTVIAVLLSVFNRTENKEADLWKLKQARELLSSMDNQKEKVQSAIIKIKNAEQELTIH